MNMKTLSQPFINPPPSHQTCGAILACYFNPTETFFITMMYLSILGLKMFQNVPPPKGKDLQQRGQIRNPSVGTRYTVSADEFLERALED